MKKTLLAIALFMASTCAFAQVNVANDKDVKIAPLQKMENGAQKLVGAKNSRISKSVKAVPDGVSLIDFSDASTYEFGIMSDHNVSDITWNLQPDTNNITDANYGLFVTFFQMDESVKWINTYFCDYENVGLSAENGLACIYPMGTPNPSQNTVHAWIKATNPVSTYGMAGVDINFGEYTVRFNRDRYYIDWSHDANFTTYDSIEYHTRGIQMQANDIARGWNTVHIPNGTTIPVVSTDPNEMTYFRIRYYSPAEGNGNGYFILIDNISISETPGERLVYYGDPASEYMNAYSMIPVGVTTDEFYKQKTVANTGVDSLANITLVSEFQAVSRNEDGTYVYTLKGTSDTPDTAKLGLSDGFYMGRYLGVNNDTSYLYRQEYNLNGYSAPQYSEEEGLYLVRNYMTYLNTVTNEQKSVELDTCSYEVEGESVTIPNHYRWGRDMNAIVNVKYSAAFTYGYTSTGSLTSLASYRTAGYKVCVGYTAGELATPMYARGVEIVPAMDSCRANTVIKGSLLVSNPDAQTWNEFITTAVDEDGNAVESFDYTLTTENLNNSATAGQNEVMYETERELQNGNTSRAYNKIYLEYGYGATPIEAGKTYYACYELVENGRFAVAKDYDGWDRFGTGSDLNLLIFTPDAPESRTYEWGGAYWPAAYADYCAPMIRLIISPEAASIKDADKENSSINVYPNPATSQVSVSYVLAQRGEATITVTDLMGRVVYTRPEGMKEAGVTNIADINVAGLENGTYFCTLNVNGTATTTKLVVNK